MGSENGAPEEAARKDLLQIAVDFDGVLFDQTPHIAQGFQRLHQVDLGPADTWHWHISEHKAVLDAGLSDDEIWEVFHTLETDHAIHQVELLDPVALEVLDRWQKAGHRVHIVTSRRPVSRAVTSAFLERNGVPHHQLEMGVWPKTGYDLLIDDLPPNVQDAAEDGALALLMDQPYNRGYEPVEGIHRVKDWAHIGKLVEGLEVA